MRAREINNKVLQHNTHKKALTFSATFFSSFRLSVSLSLALDAVQYTYYTNVQ